MRGEEGASTVGASSSRSGSLIISEAGMVASEDNSAIGGNWGFGKLYVCCGGGRGSSWAGGGAGTKSLNWGGSWFIGARFVESMGMFSFGPVVGFRTVLSLMN
jgi:hypothetical protein